MNISIASTEQDLAVAASEAGARMIRASLDERGEAVVVLATGTSQLRMLDQLVEADIDWSRVTAFHLDEYVGLSMEHPASFRRYLAERFVSRLARPLGAMHYVNGDAPDVGFELTRLADLLRGRTVDMAFVGIGENAHLAFNDPPADFETDEPFIEVELDEACRRQQVDEGWFPDIEDVLTRAISMSVQQILAARAIVAAVPGSRKAPAVHAALEGPVSPDVPASVLQRHPRAHLFLDLESAARLTRSPMSA